MSDFLAAFEKIQKEKAQRSHVSFSSIKQVSPQVNKGPKCLPVSRRRFIQRDTGRLLNQRISYHIWRRQEKGVETWLCVIWPNQRRSRRHISTEIRSYLREDVENWTIQSLRRLPYNIRNLSEIVHQDFENLANDIDFIA